MDEDDYNAMSPPAHFLQPSDIRAERSARAAPPGSWWAFVDRRLPREDEYFLCPWDDLYPSLFISKAGFDFAHDGYDYIIMIPGIPMNPEEPHNPEE